MKNLVALTFFSILLCSLLCSFFASTVIADTRSVHSVNCGIDLQIKNENSLPLLREVVLTELAKKSYLESNDAMLVVELRLFKRSDIHDPNLKYPFASMTVRSKADNRMLNYVHASGKQYQSASRAYSAENFLNAIKTAVSHLPTCK